jgi:hypothetical protein
MTAPDKVWTQNNAAALASPQRCVERGVLGPFTTPMLFGARVRGGAGEAVEVLVPHPSGREGWFVLPWPSVVEACRPTLMDRALASRLGAVPLTPARLRADAQAAAAEGLGGRSLRRAAAGAAPGRAPLAPRIQRLRSLVAGLQAWEAEAPAGAERTRARALAARSAAVLAAVLGMAGRASSGAEPEAERVDWLLDGWDLFAALWSVTPVAERLLAVRRMAALIPPIPDEVLAWPGCEELARVPAAPPQPAGSTLLPTARCEAALAAWFAAP